MKLIYLQWEDAAGAHHWQTHDDALLWAKDNNTLIDQVGWLLEENPKYLVLASRKGQHIFGSEEAEDQFYGMLQKIPKTWIRKRKTIKL